MGSVFSAPGGERPGRGDPRQADTDAVRALLDQATALSSGAVRLPAMTAAELCVLGAMTSSLIDAQRLVLVDLGTARPAAGAAGDGVAVPGLPAARHIRTGRRVATGPGRVRVAPLAALIVAGRTRPAFIVLCRPGATGEPERTRMYGIGDRHPGYGRC